MNKLVKTAYAIAGGMMLSTLVVAPAQATTAHGCGWPRVCFYQTAARYNASNPNAAYQDMGYQTLTTAAKGADKIYNSRNDDGALLYTRWDDGSSRTFCVFPNETVTLLSDETVYAINIKDSEICAG
ncbi:hypothetical protein [Catenuloplanes japonicus]|uniref:hypothetical protein n=1 Tax=Catenuloplanes japonicus TaxID=33876 RepID=UPI00052414E8|nr:hypothetical protein [Catenuloplanes japonicus]